MSWVAITIRATDPGTDRSGSQRKSNMWEIAALVGLVERKGIRAHQELWDAMNDLRARHPEATTLEGPVRGHIRRPQ